MTPRLLESYADLYAVAESVTAWDGLGYPAGAPTRAWRAVDRLRDGAAPVADVGRAATIALEIELLYLSLRQPANRRAGAARKVKITIGALTREWLNGLPMALSR